MKLRQVIRSCVVMLGLTALCAQAQQEETEEYPFLSVSGHGEAVAAPDRAVVTLGATIQAEEASAAQQQVNETLRTALENIKALGVDDDQITTVGLSLHPVYAGEDDDDPRMRQQMQQAGKAREPRIVGYRATNTIRVQLEEVGKVGDVIDAAVKAGANQIEQVSFELKDDVELRKQALREAVDEARAKARTIADAMNVRLQAVQRVDEVGLRVDHPRMEFARYAMDAAVATPVQPGQVNVVADVTIRYRLGGVALEEGGNDGQRTED